MSLTKEQYVGKMDEIRATLANGATDKVKYIPELIPSRLQETVNEVIDEVCREVTAYPCWSIRDWNGFRDSGHVFANDSGGYWCFDLALTPEGSHVVFLRYGCSALDFEESDGRALY